MFSRVVRTVIVLTACLTSLFGATQMASASTASLTMYTKIGKIYRNQSPVFTYTANAPARSNISLQRQFGTNRVWKTVSSFAARSSGTVAPPKLADVGHYYYRMRLWHSGSLLRTTGAHDIYVYGYVSIGTLCNSVAQSGALSGSCDTNTIQVGSTIFTYHMLLYDNDNVYPNFSQAMQLSRTSCRSMTLQYVNEFPDELVSYVKVIQSATDPQSSNSTPGSVATHAFALDGGPFYVDVSANSGPNHYAGDTLFSGYAMCWTPGGRR